MVKVFGIDLGTSSLKIYKKGDGIIYDAKNIIAVSGGTEVLAVGDDAFDMYEKAPSNIEVTYPVKFGVIADIKNMQALLETVLRQITARYGKLNGSEFIITAPTDITEVEKKAFVDLLECTSVKPKRVRLVDRPVADGLGADLDVTEAAGVMVVDIGADTTEVSLLSLGGIVLSRLVPIGGNKFDEDIIGAVKRKYNLIIGSKTAETLKKALATATAPAEGETLKSMNIYGRDVVTGLPTYKTIDSAFVYDAIAEHVHSIVDSVRIILEHTPPEISSDIIDSGIYVTGGSAQIANISKLFNAETGLSVHICEEPDNTVAFGLGKIIENPSLDALAYSLKHANYKD